MITFNIIRWVHDQRQIKVEKIQKFFLTYQWQCLHPSQIASISFLLLTDEINIKMETSNVIGARNHSITDSFQLILISVSLRFESLLFFYIISDYSVLIVLWLLIILVLTLLILINACFRVMKYPKNSGRNQQWRWHCFDGFSINDGSLNVTRVRTIYYNNSTI